MSTIATATGHCLCGAVSFTATEIDPHMHVCHCGMCRRWTAGPMFTLDCSGTLEIEDTTHLGVYRSSDWAEFYRLVGKDFCAVSAEAIDDKSSFVFTTQIFVDEKPPYYDFANKTKNMTGPEVFAAFAQTNG